ncbi:DUF4826 family protein [Colwellia sp. 6_MG-2023]|uniref:DUF4826 family protein n=1 Tax=Colwellia sp. 6_MG-2023 TaxID=3062676 RepID=UPI0026E46CD0|nr:DUF4826 family protein [Colwellia sp. 6_MG-2023]MDO6488595.1 DUF4826 family protein [Colwellia sp. 6_MG-2023]
MAQEEKMTVEQQQQWIREQYQIATKYLASQGLVTNSVSAEESRYFMNFMSVWKLKALDGNYYWVICGDLPSDYNAVNVAGSARDAARHFSLKWQMQAEGLLQTGEKEQEKFAQVLISKAEVLYDLVAQDNLWEIKP